MFRLFPPVKVCYTFRMHFKRIFTIILTGFLAFSAPASVAFAAEEVEDAEEISAEETGYWPIGPDVAASSAVVMEYSTGTILYEKNPTDAHYPASITKIMTGLLTVENGGLQDTLVFSEDSIRKTEGSGIARDIGEEMTVEQTLYGMMLESSNECAYALAEHVSGSIEAFADKMNERVKEIGCKNTHFSNPHGLHDENHYTCAYDMALISKEAFSNDEFRKVVGTKTYTIPFTNKHKDEETYLRNHHEMLYPLKTNKYVYPYCIGGKTGYTSDANATLVTYAEKDGMTLICVVMDAPQSSDNYVGTTALLDFCFDNFQLLNVSENEEDFAEISNTGELSEDLDFFSLSPAGSVVLPKTAAFSDLKREVSYENLEGENVVARLNYSYENRNVGSTDIVMATPDTEEFQFTTLEELAQTQDKIVAVDIKKVLVIVGIVIVGAALTVLAALTLPKIYYKWERKKSQNKKGPKYHKIENSLEKRRGKSMRKAEKKNRIKMPKGYK